MGVFGMDGKRVVVWLLNSISRPNELHSFARSRSSSRTEV